MVRYKLTQFDSLSTNQYFADVSFNQWNDEFTDIADNPEGKLFNKEWQEGLS